MQAERSRDSASHPALLSQESVYSKIELESANYKIPQKIEQVAIIDSSSSAGLGVIQPRRLLQDINVNEC